MKFRAKEKFEEGKDRESTLDKGRNLQEVRSKNNANDVKPAVENSCATGTTAR